MLVLCSHGIVEVEDMHENQKHVCNNHVHCITGTRLTFNSPMVTHTYTHTHTHTHTHTEGEDYETTGSNVDVTVPAGENRPCFPVHIINDNIFKTGRRFYYSLGSRDPHVNVVGARRGEIEIVDNDERAVTIEFEHSDYYVMENDSIVACVLLTGARVGQPFTVTVFTGQTSSISYGM